MEGDYSAENIKEQLWTEGLQEIFELRFKKGASLIKQYFQILNDEREPEEEFETKVKRIENYAKNLICSGNESHGIQFMKLCLNQYLRSVHQKMIREPTIALSFSYLEMLNNPEQKIEFIFKFRTYLKESQTDPVDIFLLALKEAEIYIAWKRFEECRINLGEEISDAQLAIIELYEIKDTVFENEAKTNNTNEYSHDRISKLDKRISLVKSYLANAYLLMAKASKGVKDPARTGKYRHISSKLASSFKDSSKTDRSKNKSSSSNSPQLYSSGTPNPKRKKRIMSANHRPSSGGARFDLDASVARLYSGHTLYKSKYRYDCVPNLVFVRENPFVREQLHSKGGLDKSVERLYNGRIQFDMNLKVHRQPFKNYSRAGFLPARNLIYKNDRALVQSSLKTAPEKYYIAQEKIHSVNTDYRGGQALDN